MPSTHEHRMLIQMSNDFFNLCGIQKSGDVQVCVGQYRRNGSQEDIVVTISNSRGNESKIEVIRLGLKEEPITLVLLL